MMLVKLFAAIFKMQCFPQDILKNTVCSEAPLYCMTVNLKLNKIILWKWTEMPFIEFCWKLHNTWTRGKSWLWKGSKATNIIANIHDSSNCTVISKIMHGKKYIMECQQILTPNNCSILLYSGSHNLCWTCMYLPISDLEITGLSLIF